MKAAGMYAKSRRLNAASMYALLVAGGVVACSSQSDGYAAQNPHGAKGEPLAKSGELAPPIAIMSTSAAESSLPTTTLPPVTSRSPPTPSTSPVTSLPPATPSTPPTALSVPAPSSASPPTSVSADAPTNRESALSAEQSASAAPCPQVSRLSELGGPKLHFSADGYVARTLTLTRTVNGAPRRQCVVVAWPEGDVTNDGKPSRVSATIDDGWFRALENTLARLPFAHAQTVQRVIIDNRPTQHGIAPFDRRSSDDARDGHTLWLNEHLFLAPSHWEYGNRGKYFAYHTNRDGKTFDGAPHDHALFSPVLLHEIGHLVMYHFINSAADPAATPACATTCADDDSCESLGPAERELGCISPYCKPFAYKGSTENFAEQYRFFYQGSATRSLLAQALPSCLQVLEQQETLQGEVAPWLRNLPDAAPFKPSRWDSCGGTACKPW